MRKKVYTKYIQYLYKQFGPIEWNFYLVCNIKIFTIMLKNKGIQLEHMCREKKSCYQLIFRHNLYIKY